MIEIRKRPKNDDSLICDAHRVPATFQIVAINPGELSEDDAQRNVVWLDCCDDCLRAIAKRSPRKRSPRKR
jgi:hypothetical protein